MCPMMVLHHHIVHKVLVIGPSGCGKSSLIESLLGRSKVPFERVNSTSGISANNSGAMNQIKQCAYTQVIPFRETEIHLKVFERTADGPLDRATICPFYQQLDTVIGVYDLENIDDSFERMREALDSLLAVLQVRETRIVYVLGNIRDQRHCKRRCPLQRIRDYVSRIGAMPLFHYCYSSSHIKAFHHLLMLSIYQKHFHADKENVERAIENCRRHVFVEHDGPLTFSRLWKRIRIPHAVLAGHHKLFEHHHHGHHQRAHH